MSITLENKQCLVAGDGVLPVRMAQYAKENGFEVICISLAKDNVHELKNIAQKYTVVIRAKLIKLNQF